jgi:hypothetical protein
MAQCKACHKEIKFILTKNGRQMPVDLPSITVITELGHVIKAYTPHWASCPNTQQFRKGRHT